MKKADRPLVLVVDDDPTVRILTGAALEAAGFAVEEARDGPEALSRYQALAPDLVLLDVNLPRADGFAVCAELRRWGVQTPVLMMTGRDDLASIERAYEVGATDFIGKPLNWTVLAQRIKYLLRSGLQAQQLSLLATAVAQAAEAIVVTDAEGRIQYVNPAFEETTGYSAAEAVGANPRILRSGKHGPAFYARMWSALGQGEVWRSVMVNRRKGGELYEEDCTISPVRGPSGEIVNYVAVKRDVTRERELERQLRQAQRLEALGTLAGGIAHDFNNLLTPMIGYSEMALAAVPEQGPLRRHLGKVLGAAERARDLVKQVMAFSQHGEASRVQLRLGALADEVLSLVTASAPPNVEIRRAPSPGGDAVLGDPVQLQQVLINLCTNAVHAMKGTGGRLEVAVEEVAVAGAAVPSPAIGDGTYVRLTVSDTGHGMPADVLERIFEPFFTTKGPGEGTGIGLAAAHGIVNRHGGAITVTSEAGHGTKFEVYLPRAPDHEACAAADPGAAPQLLGDSRILFVDDEDAVSNVAREILEDLGYAVETADSGEAALTVFRPAPDRFDLVVTDMTMPGMSGTQLVRQLLDLRPDLPVILSTGYSDAVTPAGAAAVGVREFLLKPWNRLELACAVRRALADPPGD